MASSMTWEGEIFVRDIFQIYVLYLMGRIATAAAFVAGQNCPHNTLFHYIIPSSVSLCRRLTRSQIMISQAQPALRPVS